MTEPVQCSAKYTDIRERAAHLDDGGVLFAALDELVVRELGVLVLVHIPEDFVDALERGPADQ